MMQWRNLNIDHIKQAMRDPDETKDCLDGKTKVIKDVGDKTIVVVYCKEGFRDKKEFLIITAYYKNI